MGATHPIKGDATKVRLNFRGLIGNKAKFEQKLPNFWMEKDGNHFPGKWGHENIWKVAQD